MKATKGGRATRVRPLTRELTVPGRANKKLETSLSLGIPKPLIESTWCGRKKGSLSVCFHLEGQPLSLSTANIKLERERERENTQSLFATLEHLWNCILGLSSSFFGGALQALHFHPKRKVFLQILAFTRSARS